MLEAIQAQSPDLARRGNHLLDELGDAGFALLEPHLRNVELLQGTVLQEHDAPIEHVYFLLSGVVSLISVMKGGEMIETAVVGREGAIGAFGALGPWNAFSRAVVRLPGAAAAIPVSAFQAAARQSDRIRNLILRYKDSLLAQVQQMAACNALHGIEERLARWLLQTLDRFDHPKLPLTQDLMAQMLGVRRTTITLVAGKFQEAGLIRYSRGQVVVLDRPRLEEAACECYRTIHRRNEAVLFDRDADRPHERALVSRDAIRLH
jgi:CRP-like cAMP-binding protein